MEDVNKKSVGYLLFINFGWLFLLGVIVWFFVFEKKNSYQSGYAEGVSWQNQQDSLFFAENTGNQVNQTIGTSINLRVIRVQAGSILAETIVIPSESLSSTLPESKTVVFTVNTTYSRRVILGPEIYEQRIEQALARGERAETIAPFDDISISIESIRPGDRIEVEVADSNSISLPSFVANHVAVIELPNLNP